jgi:hypothetical protein
MPLRFRRRGRECPCNQTPMMHVLGQKKFIRHQPFDLLSCVVIHFSLAFLAKGWVLAMLEFLMSLKHKFLTCYILSTCPKHTNKLLPPSLPRPFMCFFTKPLPSSSVIVCNRDASRWHGWCLFGATFYNMLWLDAYLKTFAIRYQWFIWLMFAPTIACYNYDHNSHTSA